MHVDNRGHALSKYNSKAVSEHLKWIIIALKLDYSLRSFDTIATTISLMTRRKRAWSGKYLHSVYTGSMEPRKAIAVAIRSYFVHLKVQRKRSYSVTALSDIPVPYGTVYLPNTIPIQLCKRPGCDVVFIRAGPNQKYHNTECTGIHERERKLK